MKRTECSGLHFVLSRISTNHVVQARLINSIRQQGRNHNADSMSCTVSMSNNFLAITNARASWLLNVSPSNLSSRYGITIRYLLGCRFLSQYGQPLPMEGEGTAMPGSTEIDPFATIPRSRRSQYVRPMPAALYE